MILPIHIKMKRKKICQYCIRPLYQERVSSCAQASQLVKTASSSHTVPEIASLAGCFLGKFFFIELV